MKNVRLSVLILLLSALSNQAFACSFTILEPKQSLKISSVVALAYPISVSTTPANALSPSYTGEFQQTIQWQLLVTWKGKYQPGDVLTSITTYHASLSNCGTGALYERGTKLIYLDGKEPFKNPSVYEPELMIKHLKYLKRITRGG